MRQSLNVLLIEDSEDDALLVLRELRRGQFDLVWERVQTAESLQNWLTVRPWDVIISDHQLPSFDAPRALEILNQSQLDIPFIVVSGTIGERVAVEIMKAGAHDYLMKDNLVRLSEVVRREVREAHIRAERKQADENLAKRDRYLTALVDVQRQLLTATVNPDTYGRILALLGPVVGADRMYIFENHLDATGQLLTSQQAEWCASGVMTQRDNPQLQNISYDQVMPRWRAILGAGEVIHGPVAELPKAERAILEAQEVCAVLVLPLKADGEFFGFLGLDDCTGEKRWDSLEVDLLRSAAAAIALAKEHQQATLALARLNQDLEDRVKHRTAALQESEAKLQAILNFSPTMIYVKDLDGRHIRVNQAFLSMLSCPPEAIIGKTNGEIFSPEVAQLLDAHDQAVMAGKNFQQYEERMQLGEQVYTFLSNKFLLCDREGQPYALCGISTDISDRKTAQLQLQQTNEELARATRLKDEFLANMSHELRTPLNAILGMAEGLQDGVFGCISAAQLKALQTIEHSGLHLLELINDILDVAKIESGQVELECVPAAIAPLCQSSLTFIRQQAQKKQIQLKSDIPPHLPDLWGDERRIRQVLINLLNNAVKFTPEGGQVTLQVTGPHLTPVTEGRRHGQPFYLRVAIRDTGIGIAPEHLGRLFQPFIQIDSALNRQYTGTGLGLALVKRIVELHGGQVGVTSEVGVGSCFTVDLPCVAPGKAASVPELASIAHPESSPTVLQGTAPLILLAEDNAANVGTVLSYLTAKGYRMLLAKTGEEAIALTQAEQPDLILMDIQMPGTDGLEAIRTIRQELCLTTVPIIAMTALAMPGDRERCLAMGANDHLTKPVKLKQLTATIQRALFSNSVP